MVLSFGAKAFPTTGMPGHLFRTPSGEFTLWPNQGFKKCCGSRDKNHVDEDPQESLLTCLCDFNVHPDSHQFLSSNCHQLHPSSSGSNSYPGCRVAKVSSQRAVLQRSKEIGATVPGLFAADGRRMPRCSEGAESAANGGPCGGVHSLGFGIGRQKPWVLRPRHHESCLGSEKLLSKVKFQLRGQNAIRCRVSHCCFLAGLCHGCTDADERGSFHSCRWRFGLFS